MTKIITRWKVESWCLHISTVFSSWIIYCDAEIFCHVWSFNQQKTFAEHQNVEIILYEEKIGWKRLTVKKTFPSQIGTGISAHLSLSI